MSNFFLSFIQLVVPMLAVELLKDLGTMYVNVNETVALDLYNHFEGSFLNYSITSSEGQNFYLSNNYSLSFQYVFLLTQITEIDAKIIHSYVQRESSQFLIAKGLEYFIVYYDLITGVPKFLGDNITTTLVDAKIIGGGINLPDYFLILNGIQTIEDKNFSVNEMYCFNMFRMEDSEKVNIWDLKFVENLNVIVQDLANPYFWGTLYGRFLVFVTYYNYDSVSVLEEITYFFRENSTDLIPLDIIDMKAVYQRIYIIDKSQNLIFFKVKDGHFSQHSKIPFDSLGTPLKFDINNGKKFFSLANFGVITTKGIAMFNYEPSEVNIFFPSEIPGEASISILYPHIFLYSDSWKQLRIFRFNLDTIKSVYCIPFDPYLNPVYIIRGIDQYYLMRSNFTQLELLSLTFEEPLIWISTSQADKFVITAEDQTSAASSTLNLEIIEDNNQVYLVNDYRKTFKTKSFMNYLYSLNQPIEFDLFSIVAGWNLTVEVVKPLENLIDFDIEPVYAYLDGFFSLNLTKNYLSGFYENALYSIDSQGVYVNEQLVINQTNPINLTKGSTLQVLYQQRILFYDTASNKSVGSAKISSNCSSLFKSILSYTFCADEVNFFVYKGTRIANRKTLIEVTNGEKIIDLTVTDSILEDVSIIYILTIINIHKFYYDGSFNKIMSIPADSQFIISCDNSIYLIRSSILVYDDSLTLINTIPLPGKVSAVSNIFETLYLQIEDFLYVFALNNPIIQSFIGKEYIGSCKILRSTSSVLSLCESKADVFVYNCQYNCRNSYQINIKSLDYEKTKNGIFDMQLKANVFGSDSFEQIDSSVNLVLYSFEIFFRDDELENNIIINEFNMPYFHSLDGKFRGFDISSMLYFNDSLAQDIDFPIVIKNGISNVTYEEPESQFIDHDVIREKNIFLVLLPNSINIYLLNQENLSNPLVLKSKIQSSEYFNLSGNCSTIQYISTKSSQALFLLDCTEIKTYFTYSREKILSYKADAHYFIFIVFDLTSFSISNSFKFGVDHSINWVQVIPSSSSCFIVLCVDIPYNPEQLINNNLLVYTGKWQDSIDFELLSIINFKTLNLTSMQISSADGTFKSFENCRGSIYLFISDMVYGIRNVLIEDGELSLKLGVKFNDETIFSVGVCGSMLYSLSNLTFIHAFFIHFQNVLSFQFSYKPFYQENLDMPGSLITCSSYYKARYLAVYYQSVDEQKYQLRLIDLQSSLYSSYVKFIDFYYTQDSYCAKSRFLNDNSFTSLGVSDGRLFIFNISEPSLSINSMDESQYERMMEKYKSNYFLMKIGYSNSKVSKNSSEFLVIITKTEYNKESTSFSHNYLTIIIVVLFAVLAFVLIFACLFYKKMITKRKRLKNAKMFNIYNSVENAAASHLGFTINHDSCITESN